MKDHPSLIDHMRRAMHNAVDETVNLLGYLCLSTAELATKEDIQRQEKKLMSLVQDFNTSAAALLTRMEAAIAKIPTSTGGITPEEQAALTAISTRLQADTVAIEALVTTGSVPTNGIPVITPVAALNLPINVPITPIQVVASNSPTAYAALGLPFGLSIDPNTGIISGTPSVAAVSNVTITVTNAAGAAKASVTVNVQ